MGKHSFRQIKIKGTRFQRKDVPEEDKKTNRIKRLQVYQKMIKEAPIEELPEIMNKFYSYLLKKSILTDNEFIRQEASKQVDLIISSYKLDYHISLLDDMRSRVCKLLASSFNKTFRDDIIHLFTCHRIKVSESAKIHIADRLTNEFI